MSEEFKQGLKDSIPIALVYFAVSFSVGIMAYKAGMNWLSAGIMSITNMTSAGEFAAIGIIVSAGTILEMILTQFIINLRYALMSVSLSQKFSKEFTLLQRLHVAAVVTDEIYALCMSRKKEITYLYMFGTQVLPVIGWTLGTILGAVAYSLMPANIAIAMNVALYGMFIGICIPDAKTSKPVLICILIAVAVSSLFYYVPFLKGVSSGISIIICTLIASLTCAYLYPREDSDNE